MSFLDTLKRLFGSGENKPQKKTPSEILSEINNIEEKYFDSDSWRDTKEDEFVKQKNQEHEGYYNKTKSWVLFNIYSKEDYRCRVLALNCSMRREYAKTISYCNDGLKINPTSPYLLYMRGRTYGDMGLFDVGLSDLSKAIKLQARMADAYVERGRIYLQMEDKAKANADFMEARKLEPNIELPRVANDSEANRKHYMEIIRRFVELDLNNEKYSSGFPTETQTLSDKGVKVVLDYLKANVSAVMMLYGSFPLMSQLLPELKRTPRDIDIQLKVGRAEAEKFSHTLYTQLKKIGEPVRLNPENPVIIDSNKTGKWERAVDIHHVEEPPEDSLSPMYSLNSSLEAPFRRKEQVLVDALDSYRIWKTCVELAKKNNLNASKIQTAEKLISEYKKYFSEAIDFDELKIKHHG